MDTGGGCSAAEPYALRVIGDSMEPEFRDGHIIIIDPGMPVVDGMFVIVDYDDDTTFRQYKVDNGVKYLNALNDAYPRQELSGPFRVRGVVIQRSGRRRDGVKHYEYKEELLRAQQQQVRQ